MVTRWNPDIEDMFVDVGIGRLPGFAPPAIVNGTGPVHAVHTVDVARLPKMSDQSELQAVEASCMPAAPC